jgi:hypothetical protein
MAQPIQDRGMVEQAKERFPRADGDERWLGRRNGRTPRLMSQHGELTEDDAYRPHTQMAVSPVGSACNRNLALEEDGETVAQIPLAHQDLSFGQPAIRQTGCHSFEIFRIAPVEQVQGG